MPAPKIGQKVTSKNEDQKPYYTIGIAKTDKGYEVRKLKVFGLDVETRKVILVTKDRAEAMQNLRIQVADYMISFNEQETT